jgi:hypothetical protein
MTSTNPDELLSVHERNSCPHSAGEDHFLYWPAIVAFGSPIVLILTWVASDTGRFEAQVAAYLLWCGAAIVVFVAILIWLRRRQWRRAVSAVVLPASVLAAMFNLHFVGRASIWVGDRLELLATLPTYSREIANLPHKQGPRIATFLWRDLNLGFGLAFGYEFLVYDESDEIALPAEQRSAAWRENAGSDLKCRLTGVEHVFGHYYFVGHGNDC